MRGSVMWRDAGDLTGGYDDEACGGDRPARNRLSDRRGAAYLCVPRVDEFGGRPGSGWRGQRRQEGEVGRLSKSPSFTARSLSGQEVEKCLQMGNSLNEALEHAFAGLCSKRTPAACGRSSIFFPANRAKPTPGLEPGTPSLRVKCSDVARATGRSRPAREPALRIVIESRLHLRGRVQFCQPRRSC
jgi:hypothetical protein